MEFQQSKKVLAISGDYSPLQCILKEVFEIDGEIIIQKYEADWEDFVDLIDFADVQDRAKLKVLKKVFFFCYKLKKALYLSNCLQLQTFPRVGKFELKSHP